MRETLKPLVVVCHPNREELPSGGDFTTLRVNVCPFGSNDQNLVLVALGTLKV